LLGPPRRARIGARKRPVSAWAYRTCILPGTFFGSAHAYYLHSRIPKGAMIRFRLSSEDSSIWVSASAQSRIQFADGQLCLDHQPQPFAFLEGDEWHWKSESFEDVLFDDPVMVVFIGDGGERSPNLGPFQSFRTSDGQAYADGLLLAEFDDRSSRWREISTGKDWATMTLVAADPPRRRQ
jgi:hypothetical protein